MLRRFIWISGRRNVILIPFEWPDLPVISGLKEKVFIYMFILNPGIFFLSVPIPDFVSSDRFAWTGPLRLSFTDRRNSSLRKKLYVTFPSDTTGRPFGKPNRTLVPAPMVFRHKTLHLPSALQGKEGKFYWMKGQATLTGVRIPGSPDRIIPIKYRLLN